LYIRRRINTCYAMRKVVFILIVLLASGLINESYGQKKDDKLKLESGFFGNKYYKGVWSISRGEAFNMLSENGEAYNLAIEGEKLQKTSTIISAVGAALIGYTVGSALGGAEDPKWYIAGIGGGIVLISIPIYSTGNKKIHEAIEVYNEEELSASLNHKPFIDKISIAAGSDGVGLRLTF